MLQCNIYGTLAFYVVLTEPLIFIVIRMLILLFLWHLNMYLWQLMLCIVHKFFLHKFGFRALLFGDVLWYHVIVS
jgi:hypothetical protein